MWEEEEEEEEEEEKGNFCYRRVQSLIRLMPLFAATVTTWASSSEKIRFQLGLKQRAEACDPK